MVLEGRQVELRGRSLLLGVGLGLSGYAFLAGKRRRLLIGLAVVGDHLPREVLHLDLRGLLFCQPCGIHRSHELAGDIVELARGSVAGGRGLLGQRRAGKQRQTGANT